MLFSPLRNAIREMVVRGAPAIAIAAALSLAVEVTNLEFSGTAEDAASFLVNKLEYLVSRYCYSVGLLSQRIISNSFLSFHFSQYNELCLLDCHGLLFWQPANCC